MIGAAIANVIAMLLYNSLRFIFIWKKFGLQPFGSKNLVLLISGSLVILVIYMIPHMGNLYLDGIIRTVSFALLFSVLVLKGNFSDEINQIWKKWSKKIPGFN